MVLIRSFDEVLSKIVRFHGRVHGDIDRAKTAKLSFKLGFVA